MTFRVSDQNDVDEDHNDDDDDDDNDGGADVEVDDGWLSVRVIGHRPSPPQCFASSNLSLSVAIPTFSCPRHFSLPFPAFSNSSLIVASDASSLSSPYQKL